MNLRAWFDGPRPWRFSMVVAVLLGLPSLDLGLAADDHVLRANLARDPRLPELWTAPWDAFHFFPRGAGLERGFATWWSSPGGYAHHLRPLASLTHWLDWHLWPRPVLMHAHSVLWYAAVCAVAALLYRRLIPGWAAGLAALMFAVDFTHGALAGWIANRNALLAGALGLGALYLHHRGKHDGVQGASLAAPMTLALGLASGEVALSASAYLLAYVVCLETGGAAAKLRSLAPYGVVVGAWAVVHSTLGFGTVGSGMYLDPRSDPSALLAALPARLVLLLGAELGGPGPDAWPLVGAGPRAALVASAAVALALALAALAPLLRRDATARFFALGSLLSALPMVAAFPSSRLTLIPSFGLGALVATAFAAWRDGAPLPAIRASRRVAVAFAALAGGAHLFLSPLLFVWMVRRTAAPGRAVEALIRGLPDDAAKSGRQLVVVNLPDALFTMYLRATLATQGRPVPAGSYLLGLGTHALELDRTDEHTLVVRDPSGLYGDDFSSLFRPLDSPMPVGTKVEADTTTAEVRASPSGVPTEVAFRFEAPLGDPSLQFVAWDGETLVPFTPPEVGSRVSLPPRPHPLLRLP